MLMNILYGLPVMALCLLLQSVLVIQAFRFYAQRKVRDDGQTSFWSTMLVMNMVMVFLVVGNISQIVAWAMLYQFLGEFVEIGDALYHSAVNFTTLGYGDIIMSEKHRLLGTFEALNGVLMIGVSTAALMAFLQDSLKSYLNT